MAGKKPTEPDSTDAEQPQVDPRLRRPTDDIPDRPALHVKGRERNAAAPGRKASKEQGPDSPAKDKTEAEDPFAMPAEDKPEAEDPFAMPAEDKPPKKVSLPSPEEVEARYAYATHRPPPEESSPRRQVSTAFLLGVALIVVALLTGIVIARLRDRITGLEVRVARLEGVGPAQNPPD